MTDEPALDTIMGLLAAGAAVEAPAVAPVRSVIRSGDQFLLAGQTDTGAPRATADIAAAQDGHIGHVVVEWGYDVEHKLAEQFRRWLLDNEALLQAKAPKGVTYRGTYAVTMQSDLSLGDYRTVWAYDGLTAMGAMDMHAADPKSRFGKLLVELASFRDRRIGAGRSQQMYQPAAASRRI